MPAKKWADPASASAHKPGRLLSAIYLIRLMRFILKILNTKLADHEL